MLKTCGSQISRFRQAPFLNIIRSSRKCDYVQKISSFTREKRSKSPFDVLELPKNSSKSYSKSLIKSQFRKLAKLYHPDLNRGESQSENENKMIELIEAYDLLMDDDLFQYTRQSGASRVATACELFSLNELCDHPNYDVYGIRVIFENEEGNESSLDEEEADPSQVGDGEQNFEGSNSLQFSTSIPILMLKCHSNDSVSDVKRLCQERFGKTWGLQDRLTDRENLAVGWEIMTKVGIIMSYHLFLKSYDVSSYEIVYAVIEKTD